MTDLKNFVETTSCQTMSEAARKLEITQPALSESIKRFESDLGEIVFYRSRSGIRLTPSGQVILERSKTVLDSLSEIENMGQKSEQLKGRLITLGCHYLVASYALPKALKLLEKDVPNYRINLKHGLSRDVQADIQKGLIDIGIVINPTRVPDLVIKKIGLDEVCVWSSGASKTPDKLICNLDLFQTQSILRKWKHAPKDIINTDSLELIARLVDNNIGYGIVPERAVNLLNYNFKKHTEYPQYKDEICLVHRPEFGKNEYEKKVISSLKSALHEI